MNIPISMFGIKPQLLELALAQALGGDDWILESSKLDGEFFRQLLETHEVPGKS